MLWLWKGPLPFVPPEGRRTVIGQGIFVRQYCVPALFRIWFNATLEKSANCISTIGRIPSMRRADRGADHRVFADRRVQDTAGKFGRRDLSSP